MNENIIPIVTAVGGLLSGLLGAYIPRAIEGLKARRNEDRLDTVIVADNLQKIINDLRAEQRELKTHHQKCLDDSVKQQGQIAKQTHEIQILWYTVRKLRAEIAEMKKAHDNASPSRVLPPESPPNS